MVHLPITRNYHIGSTHPVCSPQMVHGPLHWGQGESCSWITSGPSASQGRAPQPCHTPAPSVTWWSVRFLKSELYNERPNPYTVNQSFARSNRGVQQWEKSVFILSSLNWLHCCKLTLCCLLWRNVLHYPNQTFEINLLTYSYLQNNILDHTSWETIFEPGNI